MSNDIFQHLCVAIESTAAKYPSLGIIAGAIPDIARRLAPTAALSGDLLTLPGYFDVGDALSEMRLQPGSAHLFSDKPIGQTSVTSKESVNAGTAMERLARANALAMKNAPKPLVISRDGLPAEFDKLPPQRRLAIINERAMQAAKTQER